MSQDKPAQEPVNAGRDTPTAVFLPPAAEMVSNMMAAANTKLASGKVRLDELAAMAQAYVGLAVAEALWTLVGDLRSDPELMLRILGGPDWQPPTVD